MSFIPTASRAVLAEPLADDEIRLVFLPYQTEQRRAPLLELLAIHLGVATRDLRIAEDAHGKPRLSGPHHLLQFNWSHSGHCALLALAAGVEPGVDLERHRPRTRALDIARRYFAPAELAQLERARDSERTEMFLRIWTAKEALLKALGRGLAFGLDRLSVHLGANAALQLTFFENQHPPDWQLQPVWVEDGYTSALAWRGSARRVNLVRWQG